MSGMLDPIVLIFILLSAVLSFVVLYNLNNINVSERIRELSTIKVLGFFDREVTMYISRESIVLTVIGIVFGYLLGNLLTAYILYQAETEAVVFPLTISIVGYLTATLLMLAFTGVVTWLTHRRLQRVDMVEALKSNELLTILSGRGVTALLFSYKIHQKLGLKTFMIAILKRK